MHFLELLEQVSDRDTAVYYAKHYGEIPTRQQSAAKTLAHKLTSFDWELSPQGHSFWDDLCDKLRLHPSDCFVTYEPEVYHQYKTEVFDSAKSIKDYSILIKNTSIEDRRKLHSLLHCLDEPVFKSTGLSTDYAVCFHYFRWDTYDGAWAMARTVGDESGIKNKTIVTIEEFIDLFGTKQEPEKTEAEPILEVLEEKSETTTKTTKKETFMSKLKTTALNTLEQNKQAAIIAAKVDAGRIINKQVIKQLKPHVPMLLRGYLDTPLAPVIAANVVAMIGNHTDNSKVKKVSELMLLGAADATVQSFNLDKIIDDVLAGIKLPAGFLDADDN